MQEVDRVEPPLPVGVDEVLEVPTDQAIDSADGAGGHMAGVVEVTASLLLHNKPDPEGVAEAGIPSGCIFFIWPFPVVSLTPFAQPPATALASLRLAPDQKITGLCVNAL